LRVIIVVVQVGAVKIYVAAVEAFKKKERQDETQFTTQNWWKKISLGPSYFVLIKLSLPVTYLMLYYAETGHSHSLIA
jgi:hypothetical protein